MYIVVSNSVTERLTVCVLAVVAPFHLQPPCLFSHLIAGKQMCDWREKEYSDLPTWARVLLFSHFNHLNRVYEKRPKITQINFKTQGFAGSKDISVSLLFLFSPHPTHTFQAHFILVLEVEMRFQVQNRSLESFTSLFCSWREPNMYVLLFVTLLMNSVEPTRILIVINNLKCYTKDP